MTLPRNDGLRKGDKARIKDTVTAKEFVGRVVIVTGIRGTAIDIRMEDDGRDYYIQAKDLERIQ